MSIFNSNDRVLIIAPHCDDEILGCGGTLKLLSNKGIDTTLYFVTGHGENFHPIWTRETWDIVREEAEKASEIIGINKIIYGDLPAVCLPDLEVHKVNKVINSIVNKINPTIVFSPWMGDMHKDHEVISYALSVCLRPHLINNKDIRLVLAYEVLSETDLAIKHHNHQYFNANLFCDISEVMNSKLDALRCYKSQLFDNPNPRSIESSEALAKLRGSHIGTNYAEAFSILYGRT